MAYEKFPYIYDANGTKLRKYYYEDNRLMSTTDYMGMFVYKDYHIDYIQTSEGHLKWNDHDSLFYAEYFIKDHLGNVRDVITTDPNFSNSLLQVTDYYPFGLEFQDVNTSDNLQLYNSKELQRDAKLDWYDYGARFYDPIICRWTSVDPMAETSRRWSPYAYCMNNPIRYIDPDGMETGYPPFIGPTNPLRIASELYNNLPSDVTRTIGATWNMVSGGAQFLGGAAFATVTSPTVAGEVVGGLVAMHGAFKFVEGVHQLANVASGTNSNEDPQYVTPEGSITESKVVDGITDLVVGSFTGDAGSTVVTINAISTLTSATALIEAVKNNSSEQVPKTVEQVKETKSYEEHHTRTRSYYQEY